MDTLTPRANLNLKTLQPALKALVTRLKDELRDRCDTRPEVNGRLQGEYEEARAAQRTVETFSSWREAYLDQVAVAWVLASLFVRYLEEHGLVDEVWLAGDGDRAKEAQERHADYFRQHPELSDREYLQHVFDHAAGLPGCADLFGRERNPLWRVGLSGDGAKMLLSFRQEKDPDTGLLRHGVATESGDTRFLGDLYQNLSEDARKLPYEVFAWRALHRTVL